MENNQLAPAKAKLDEALTGALAFEVNSPETHAFACEQLIVVKKNAKHFKDQKETATKPLNAGLKAVRDMFRPIETVLDKMEETLKSKIGKYERDIKVKEAADLAEATRLFQSGQQAQGLIILNQVPEVAVAKQQGVSTRVVVKFEITDPKLVPREYCAPVEALIRAQVGAFGMGTQIPGVRVYEDTMVVGRI